MKTSKTNLVKFSEMTTTEKYDFLNNNVYNHIEASSMGGFTISTSKCRLAAKLLGGNYDELNKKQKGKFKCDLYFMKLNVEVSFDKYTN